MNEPLLEVRGLVKHFPVRRGGVGGVSGRVRVSLEVRDGEVLGLVGESGCGKTRGTLAVLRLLEPTAGGDRFAARTTSRACRARLRRCAADRHHLPGPLIEPQPAPEASGSMLAEPLAIHGSARGAKARERVAELLELVGLSPDHARRYPHEFSGGQRQRLGVARALAVEPRLIVADEPVSALDVSIRAQILNLLLDLQRRLGLAYLFVAHDLAVVEHVSDRVAVMYLGRLVEVADARALYASPRHPYTAALLSAIPLPDPDRARRARVPLEGDVPSPLRPPSGCRFHPRCPLARERCRRDEPELLEVGPGHVSACHFSGEVATIVAAGPSGPTR